MPFNKKYYEQAREELDARRAANKQLEEERNIEIHTKIPEYGVLECQLVDTMTEIMRSIAERRDNNEELIKNAIENNKLIQQKMNMLLAQKGYPADYLNPIYSCPKCKDTGTVDGQWCDCFNKVLRRIAAEQLNADSPLQLSEFSTFKLDYYSDKTNTPIGVTPRRIMEDNLNDCISFAENFNGKGKGLFMIGATGLGKTHLSLAIGNRVIEKGFCVAYGSVPEIIRKIDREQFGKAEGDTMGLAMESDLLILDDLGAENRTDRAVSILYEIINARQNRGLPIIVNTNLDPKDIKNSYQDRLYSRLNSLKVLFFFGDDNRLKNI